MITLAIESLQEKIGYEFKEKELLTQAMVHKSYRNENRSEVSGDNEKMEFLGDAILDFLISEILMDLFPKDTEGDLSQKRAAIVSEQGLAEVGRELEINQAILMGRGESRTGGTDKPRLVASAFEALIGAVYLDGGFEAARLVAVGLFKKRIGEVNFQDRGHQDFKTRFQEEMQKKYKQPPSYRLVKEEGPPHDRTFHVELYYGDHVLARGVGRTKKQAEQEAAFQAMENIDE